MQSLLSMVAILALGLFLIYRLVGKALAPLDTLTCRIRERTAADLAAAVEIPTAGMRRPHWPWRSIRCPSG